MRLHYEVHGKVQGVGFRMTALAIAERMKLTGYVRNTDRKTVEGEVQGSRESVTKFIHELEKGPAGRVDKVDNSEIPEDDTSSAAFNIR